MSSDVMLVFPIHHTHNLCVRISRMRATVTLRPKSFEREEIWGSHYPWLSPARYGVFLSFRLKMKATTSSIS